MGMSSSETSYHQPDPARKLTLLAAQNERLSDILREARERIKDLQRQLEELATPPGTYGTFLGISDDGYAIVSVLGRKMVLQRRSEIELSLLSPGQEVRLSESMTVIGVLPVPDIGDIVKVKEVLPNGTVIIVGRGDDEKVILLGADIKPDEVRPGDSLVIDTKASIALHHISNPEIDSLVLAEVPDVDFEDIGGLHSQIEQIRDAIELPFTQADLYKEHGLTAPKGVLLYGPPGCGKTLVAKAVAASLSKVATDSKHQSHARTLFLSVKGPELLNKYVGETERHIRALFSQARERARMGDPVVIFFDEMESLFRTRGTGISSDMETTVVPQLLAEMDGITELSNVIVIGASNREDMIDPAILRPGRLDVKIKIERPTAVGAAEIFAKYLTDDLPIHDEELAKFDLNRANTVSNMIQLTVNRMYSTSVENEFLEVSYQSGATEVLYFKDFTSGAMIRNIVDRAKKEAIKRFLAGDGRGLKLEYLLTACAEEFLANEDLPNTTNPEEWARISGKRGERIVQIRTLHRNSGNGNLVAHFNNVSPISEGF